MKQEPYSATDTESMCRKYLFLQFYEMLGEDKLSVDEIDSTLEFVRFRWHRKKGINTFSSRKEFVLVPFECIKE